MLLHTLERNDAMQEDTPAVMNEQEAQKKDAVALTIGLVSYPIILAVVGGICAAIFLF